MIASSLLCLALAAPQGTVSLTFGGSVAVGANTLTESGMRFALPGEWAEVTFEVETPGSIGGPQIDRFSVVTSTVFASAGLSGLIGSSSSMLWAYDQSPAGLGDTLRSDVFLTGSSQVTLSLEDPTSSAWASVDLAELAGTYPASAFAQTTFLFTDAGGGLLVDFQSLVIEVLTDPLGSSFCGPGAANSTGTAGQLTANGSLTAASNNVTLTASALPRNAFGFFLASLTQQAPTQPTGSQGNLCLGGAIGRYVGPGQILQSGSAGSFALDLDLSQTPQPTGTVAISSGMSWNFQAWHRDRVAGSATSNLTTGLNITFQ